MSSAAANPRGAHASAAEASALAAANRHGILAMLASMTLFTGNDAILKVATAQLPTGQIMAVRGAFAVAIVLGLMAARRELGQIRAVANGIVMCRALIETSVSFLFILALAHLPLANITAILQATPIILTLIAVLLGIERVGWRRWVSIVVGFAGVLLIVRPSLSGFNTYALISLGTAILIAVRDLVTRTIRGHIPTTLVTLTTTLAITGTGLLLSFAEEWQPLTAAQIGLLALAALFVSLGNLAIVQAFRVGEMSVVSPFRYFIILTSLAAGFVLFDEWPDLIACSGIALVVLSGLYAIRREQMRQRRAAAGGGAEMPR